MAFFDDPETKSGRTSHRLYLGDQVEVFEDNEFSRTAFVIKLNADEIVLAFDSFLNEDGMIDIKNQAFVNLDPGTDMHLPGVMLMKRRPCESEEALLNMF
tara:strand:- start:94 stop:393 length:300 start_codon:yes stop_codon:yes gene_type:complete